MRTSDPVARAEGSARSTFWLGFVTLGTLAFARAWGIAGLVGASAVGSAAAIALLLRRLAAVPRELRAAWLVSLAWMGVTLVALLAV